ncbi:MAG: hypothetical protein Q7R42_02365 [Candidatus Planktophila sp.]|nr:hypothetical protein [Candidatus Planktophila sp.]
MRGAQHPWIPLAPTLELQAADRTKISVTAEATGVEYPIRVTEALTRITPG